MKWGRRTTSAVAAAAVLVVGLSAWGIAAIPGSDGVIHGCVGSTGTLRVVDPDASQTCRKGEQAVNWNQTGPKGDAGAPGPAGTPGRSVCGDEDLLLCMPVREDLEPRLTIEGGETLRGDGYRIELAHKLVDYREGGESEVILRKLVDSSTHKLVLTADLVDASTTLMAWFESAAMSSSRHGATLRLYDGDSAVWAAFLESATPESIRIADGRIQITLVVQDISRVAP